MPRNIKELFSGKKKILDKPLHLPAVLNLVNNLAELTTIDITRFRIGEKPEIFAKVEPAEAAIMVQSDFQEYLSKPEKYYCRAHYRVYAGKKDERHYIDLIAGIRTGRAASLKITLEYIAKKRDGLLW